MPGGRSLLAPPWLDSDRKYSQCSPEAAPAQRSAAAPLNGDLARTARARGTSNASALASRAAAFAMAEVVKLRLHPGNSGIVDVADAVLLKALLVHAAKWRDRAELEQCLPIGFKQKMRPPKPDKVENTKTTRKVSQVAELKINKTEVAWLWGYGVVDSNEIGNCDSNRVTVVGGGEIAKDQAIVHQIPVPPSMAPAMKKKRLTVTMANLTPVNPASARWRGAKVRFEVKGAVTIGAKKNLARENDHNIVTRGTVQHEVFEGTQVQAIAEDATIEIVISCLSDGLEAFYSVPYALVVSIEVSEDVDIYSEVKARIEVRPDVQIVSNIINP